MSYLTMEGKGFPPTELNNERAFRLQGSMMERRNLVHKAPDAQGLQGPRT